MFPDKCPLIAPSLWCLACLLRPVTAAVSKPPICWLPGVLPYSVSCPLASVWCFYLETLFCLHWFSLATYQHELYGLQWNCRADLLWASHSLLAGSVLCKEWRPWHVMQSPFGVGYWACGGWGIRIEGGSSQQNETIGTFRQLLNWGKIQTT